MSRHRRSFFWRFKKTDSSSLETVNTTSSKLMVLSAHISNALYRHRPLISATALSVSAHLLTYPLLCPVSKLGVVHQRIGVFQDHWHPAKQFGFLKWFWVQKFRTESTWFSFKEFLFEKTIGCPTVLESSTCRFQSTALRRYNDRMLSQMDCRFRDLYRRINKITKSQYFSLQSLETLLVLWIWHLRSIWTIQ